MIDGVVPESQNSAVPFLQSASKVVIVMVTTGAKQGPEPEEIVANLAWHDVEAEVKRLEPDYRPVGETFSTKPAISAKLKPPC